MANLTLVVDDEVLASCKRLAFARNTSVDSMIQEFLCQLVDSQFIPDEREHSEKTELMESFFGTHSMGGKGITWKREDLYDRHLTNG